MGSVGQFVRISGKEFYNSLFLGTFEIHHASFLMIILTRTMTAHNFGDNTVIDRHTSNPALSDYPA